MLGSRWQSRVQVPAKRSALTRALDISSPAFGGLLGIGAGGNGKAPPIGRGLWRACGWARLLRDGAFDTFDVEGHASKSAIVSGFAFG